MKSFRTIMIDKKNCPVCDSNELKILFTTTLPVLQNRVFPTKDEAKQSAQGKVTLALCADCKFVFNSEFDEDIIIYDENYDNSISSLIFRQYYDHICTYLFEKYDLANGTVYDIGCGKGAFLKQLCEKYPEIKGIGIDPSYVGETNPADNIQFIVDIFRENQVIQKPALVIVRHVFEHMEYPVDFLKAILAPLAKFNDVPLFIEVPDFAWIIQNHTFWDICYEHCNYFSDSSLVKLFQTDGCRLLSISRAFHDQYLWAESLINPVNKMSEGSKGNLYEHIQESDALRFTESIATLSNNITRKLTTAKNEGWEVVIWGMATKGVIFSNLIDAEHKLIDYCIDINKDKQGRFSPISAHKICPPEVLAETNNPKKLVVVMNPNYKEEIKRAVHVYTAEADFIDAHGVPC